jgi:hypothetical protein
MHRYLAEFDFRYSHRASAPTKPLLAASASVSPIGGLVRSPSNYFEPPLWWGERRKRWTR